MAPEPPPAAAGQRPPGAAAALVRRWTSAAVVLAALAAMAAGSALQQTMELRLAAGYLSLASAAVVTVGGLIGGRGRPAWAAVAAGLAGAFWVWRAAFFAADAGLGWLWRWWAALGPSFRAEAMTGLPITIGPTSVAILAHACGSAWMGYRAARGETVATPLVGGAILLGLEIAYLTHAIAAQVIAFFAAGLGAQLLTAWVGRERRWLEVGAAVSPRFRRRWGVRAGGVAMIALAAAWWLPSSGPTVFVESERLRFLDGVVADLLIGPDPRDRTPVFSPRATDPPGSIPAAAAGYGWSDGQLGGPFRKTGRLLMAMRSPRSVYLRGESKDTYTGRGWLNSEAPPPPPLLPGNLGELGAPPPEPRLEPPLRFDLSDRMLLPDADRVEDVDVEISYSSAFQPWPPVVFAPWPTRALQLPDAAPLRAGLRVDAKSGNIYAPLRRSQPLPLDYKATAALAPLDLDALRQLSAPESGFAEYLQLPESLPARVRELARQLTREAASDYDKAARLESWLKTMPYAEDMPASPAGVDFVDDFLFNQKRGYCVYFSSAMVVMARSLGLPARWVKGFTSGDFDSELLTYSITDAHAHAWVEVYFEEHGWVPFDPTPGFAYPREVVALHAPAPDTPAASAPPATPDATGPAWTWTRTFAGASLLGLLGGAAWWIGRTVPRVVGGAADGPAPREPAEVAARIRAWFRRLEERLRRVGLARRHHETPAEFQARVARAIPPARAALARLVHLYVRARYGNAELAGEDAERAAAAAREVERAIGGG